MKFWIKMVLVLSFIDKRTKWRNILLIFKVWNIFYIVLLRQNTSGDYINVSFMFPLSPTSLFLINVWSVILSIILNDLEAYLLVKTKNKNKNSPCQLMCRLEIYQIYRLICDMFCCRWMFSQLLCVEIAVTENLERTKLMYFYP